MLSNVRTGEEARNAFSPKLWSSMLPVSGVGGTNKVKDLDLKGSVGAGAVEASSSTSLNVASRAATLASSSCSLLTSRRRCMTCSGSTVLEDVR
jgi:hypothetical protein